jgi:8-oxo-dGTP pyrophosphatase MutT (NUDIX family)
MDNIASKMMIEKIISAGAVIVNKDKEYIFEIKPKTYACNPGGVALFGGKAEEGEDGIACIKRELMEELKFDIDEQNVDIKLIGYERSVKSNGVHIRYLIEDVDDSQFVLSEESDDMIKVKDLQVLLDSDKVTGRNGTKFAINILLDNAHDGTLSNVKMF